VESEQQAFRWTLADEKASMNRGCNRVGSQHIDEVPVGPFYPA
jgi:hypothetical protein